MNLYFIYRPSTKEYLRFYDDGPYGPHLSWTPEWNLAFPFGSMKKAARAAEVIRRADGLNLELITFKEIGRTTIDFELEAS